jgi:thioredoxin reductase
MKYQYDLIVIGSGSSGFSAASAAKKFGAKKILLVEKRQLAPLIKAKYPGTSGKVQGARKVRMPAINEGITSEKSIFKLQSYF